MNLGKTQLQRRREREQFRREIQETFESIAAILIALAAIVLGCWLWIAILSAPFS